MRIGELATAVGVSTSRIRFYEEVGVLSSPMRTNSGYRDYDDRTVRTLRFVVRAQALGFTLREIVEHLRDPRSKERKARLKERLESKLEELDGRLRDLNHRRAAVALAIDEMMQVRLD